MLKSLFTLSSTMEYHILTTENKDLPWVVDLNQDALPAVSSITLNNLTQFLKMADYFRVIKVKNDIANGKAKSNVGILASANRLRLSIMKSVYLKYPSKAMFETIPNVRSCFFENLSDFPPPFSLLRLFPTT